MDKNEGRALHGAGRKYKNLFRRVINSWLLDLAFAGFVGRCFLGEAQLDADTGRRNNIEQVRGRVPVGFIARRVGLAELGLIPARPLTPSYNRRSAI